MNGVKVTMGVAMERVPDKWEFRGGCFGSSVGTIMF